MTRTVSQNKNMKCPLVYEILLAIIILFFCSDCSTH